jgi:uncharacterized protein
MKILCVSDQVDPLVYSAAMKDRFKDIDFVLSAGDLPFEYLDFIVSILNVPLYYVLGNHDQSPDENRFDPENPDRRRPEWDGSFGSNGAIDVGSKGKSEGRVLIVGLAGCRRYNRGSNQYTELQMWLKALALLPRLLLNRVLRGRYLDILLTHAAPLGIHDRNDICHRGFASFRWLMKAFKPRYLIHGHIHLYDMNDVRLSKFFDTTVINAFSHCVVDLGDEYGTK